VRSCPNEGVGIRHGGGFSRPVPRPRARAACYPPPVRIEAFLESLGRSAIATALGQEAPALVRPTTDARHGDYQLNGVLPLAKQLKKNPRELAETVAAELRKEPPVASAEVAGPGFVNLRLDDGWLARSLDADLRDPRDGVPEADHKERVVVDFSGPNIAKQMHVGHLRSTIIGDALIRTLRFLGHDVIGDNHLGDWGTQFGLLIVGMRELGNEAALREDAIVELERVYKLASERAKSDEAFAAAARAELAKLQAGDADNTALWERFVAVTKAELDKVYERLEITFDTWYGESFYNPFLADAVALVRERGIAREDEGALCIFFNELEQAPAELKKQKEPFIVQKRDGAFLYSTTDIATVRHRREVQNATRMIYVVDMRQSQHFKQLFAVARLLGYDDVRLEHLGFGSVLGKDGKPLKTRDASGKAITLASLLDEAEARALARLSEGKAEGKMDLSDEELPKVARAVGIGAVKYADLHQNRSSDYMFDFDKMITFQGNAGPYMQYAYARVQSIFRKGGVEASTLAGPVVLEAAEEKVLARALLRFGEVVHQAADSGLPHLITDHLYELARAYSAFFEACPVLKSEGATRESRLALCFLTARQLRRGLGLLGIATIERM
jgi:arginyl-tRNA synthetase